MPLYEFLCRSCGTFEEQRSFEEAGKAAACPVCCAPARRVYSAPGVISTSKGQRMARRLNEQGAEPGLVKKEPAEQPAPKPVRGHGRPWQLGH